MFRRILLSSVLLALAGCDSTEGGDDGVVAIALGRIQPALEAQSALLVRMSSCTGCSDLPTLSGHLRSALGACAEVTTLSSYQSDCGHVDGRPVVRARLTSCDLGLGRSVSGELHVAQNTGSDIRYFETDLAIGGHGVIACGQATPASASHLITFDAVAHGSTGGDVYLSWNGGDFEDESGAHRRNGTMSAEFTGSDGIGYILSAEAVGLARNPGVTLPHAGRINFQGVEGMAKMEFSEETPATGAIHVTHSNGRRETVAVDG